MKMYLLLQMRIFQLVMLVSELRGSKMLVAKVTPERRTALAVKKETLFVHNES